MKKIVFFTLAFLLLQGCSSVHDRQYEYLNSTSQAPPKYPAGLGVTHQHEYYDIPKGARNSDPEAVTFVPPDFNPPKK